MAQKILILGGGFSGMFAAQELCRKLNNRAEIELINSENYFVFQPLLPEVAGGAITPSYAVTPLRFLLRDVFVRKARMESVDFERKVVTVFQGVQRRPTEVAYDHLIIAMGQGVDLSRTPGLAEHALTMKTLEDARQLRAHVIERLEHAEITNLPEVRKGALTFCVIGGGFSGIETVGEIKELIDRALKFYPHIDPRDIRVKVIEFAPRILAEMPQNLRDYAMAHLKKRGIEVMLETGVASATATQLVTTHGEVIDTRTIVATIGNAPSRVIRDMDLPLQHGRIAVERTLAVPGLDNVWALGDCAMIPMKEAATERSDFAPPTAQFAVREARQLAANIEAVFSGKPVKPFEYKSQGALASLGAKRGVAEVWGYTLTGFLAWLLWRSYYILFLPGFVTRIRVMINWTLDALSSRDLVVLGTQREQPVRYARYRAGDRVFEKGNRTDGVYTIIEGAMELTFDDEETGEARVSHLGPGESFGERMILGRRQRSGTVQALEDSKVLILDRETYLKMADGFDVFQRHFEEQLKARYGIDDSPAEKS